ncbi:MAG: hypothetical protein KDE50_32185, partial [Caldilineaceae bacterium]|nr:hypothetical protein [Caldilineaceae bacterium]
MTAQIKKVVVHAKRLGFYPQYGRQDIYQCLFYLIAWPYIWRAVYLYQFRGLWLKPTRHLTAAIERE